VNYKIIASLNSTQYVRCRRVTYKEVPPDNNGSERAIRNVKVKMKISNQFKSFEFAQHYAVIRSVIDTTIKNSMNVLDALTNLANQKINPAE